MVQHVDPDQLALLALGERLPGGDEQELTAHLASCVICTQEVRSLQQTADLARETVAHRDEEALRPPESVWSGIVAELGLGAAGPPPRADRSSSWPEQPSPRSERPSAWPEQSPPRSEPWPSRPESSPPRPESSPRPESPAPGPEPERARPDAVDPPADRRADTGPVQPWEWFSASRAVPDADRRRTDPGTGERHLPRSPGTPRHAGPGRPAARPARSRRWARTAVALAAAAAVGVVGTLAAVRPWQERVTTPPAVASPTASLAPVPGGPFGVSGQALVVRGASGPELRVNTAGLPPLNQGYYEVWVFDGRENMVAVGVLGSDARASLPLPSTLDLRTFAVVDISQEKYDGDQTHSETSVLRGTLTG